MQPCIFRSALPYFAILAVAGNARLLLCEDKTAPEEKRDVHENSEVIEKLILKLASDEYDEREAAMKELLRIGEPTVSPLKRALESHKEPEFAVRANRVIRLYEGGGEAVNGLKLTLSSEQRIIRPDETLKMKVVLGNTTEKPMRVLVGYETINGDIADNINDLKRVDNLFENGTGLRSLLWVDDWGRTGPRVVEMRPRTVFDPFRGRLMETPSVFAVIAPKSTLTYESRVTFRQEQKEKGGYETLAYYELGFKGSLGLDVPATGTHRLRFFYDLNPKTMAEPKPEVSAGTPKEAPVPIWGGSVFSNEIEVKVEPKKP